MAYLIADAIFRKDVIFIDSIKKISLKTNMGEDFYLLLGNFLDSFYRTNINIREKMILSAPINMANPELVPFLAATTHKLALDYDLTIPTWVFESRCYLPGKKPFFACNAKGNLRLLFMYKSPSEFKYRNLFVDENVLIRV